jgi:hypothetical protein
MVTWSLLGENNMPMCAALLAHVLRIGADYRVEGERY